MREPAQSRAPSARPLRQTYGLRAKGLCFDVGEQRLIDSVDLDIRDGACTVIMGANGAGKSLLLRLLHGLIAPNEGQVLWQERPLDAAARRVQSMVFQRPVMLRRSVLANMRFALKVRGVRGRELARRAHEALVEANLADIASRPARVLSGGEQQRLAVARALATRPQILFLDEPAASLDPLSTQAIERLIAAAKSRGVTIVLITHDIGQARRLGDDLVFMHDRRIVERGPLERVLRAPQSMAARAWLEGRLYLDGADPDPSDQTADLFAQTSSLPAETKEISYA